ncbi:MAG TPA: hypothetical protein VFW94_13850 [Candidatus Acidoferrales bacterium]|nr:hypothetical protein [Candidatus Acidoferrales bacterium]
MDGTIEWPTATPGQKTEYLFPVVLRVNLLLGFLFASLLAFVELPDWRGVIVVALWEIGIMLVPVVIYFIRSFFQIRASVRRYERLRLSEVGYGGYASPKPS